MYESHQSEPTITGNPLTDFDYQLMLEANALASRDTFGDFDHTDYMSLLQGHPISLDSTINGHQFHHDDQYIETDLNHCNNSQEQLYYYQQQQQRQLMNLHSNQDSSIHMALSHSSNSNLSSSFHPQHPMYLTSSSTPPSTVTPSSSASSISTVNMQNNNNNNNSNNNEDLCARLTHHGSSHSLISQPHHLYNSSHNTTSSETLLYSNLDDYNNHQQYPHHHRNSISTSSSSFYNPSSLEELESSINQYQSLEKFYGQSLDEQQQFFLMQQQQQQLWIQQQQQLFQHHHHQLYSSSSTSSSSSSSLSSAATAAYTTDSDPRPQIYVRKACVACKQSHVACDVQRPCSRCVRLNKADSCVDAERKKRGRPCGSGKKKKDEEKEIRKRDHSLLR